MRSAAHIFKSHPIHPMLIPFPIAFLSCVLLADLIARFMAVPIAGAIAYSLEIAGVAAGVLAAIPGLIDYASLAPPRSVGRKVATLHMLSNSVAIVLFLAAWLTRGTLLQMPSWSTLALELFATGALLIGGSLGGKLAYRYQFGVEHQYAGAGEWTETTVQGVFGGRVAVASPGELAIGQMKLVHLIYEGRERRIVLGRTESGYVAFDDRCSHQGGPLSDGTLARGCVQCPWHGSQFDAKSGWVVAGPAQQPVGTYEIRELPDRVELVVPDSREHRQTGQVA